MPNSTQNLMSTRNLADIMDVANLSLGSSDDSHTLTDTTRVAAATTTPSNTIANHEKLETENHSPDSDTNTLILNVRLDSKTSRPSDEGCLIPALECSETIDTRNHYRHSRFINHSPSQSFNVYFHPESDEPASTSLIREYFREPGESAVLIVSDLFPASSEVDDRAVTQLEVDGNFYSVTNIDGVASIDLMKPLRRGSCP